MDNDGLKDRIKEIMDDKHMINIVFANETGINPGTLSLLLRGKTQPTLKHYEAIHNRFPDISMEWLFDGTGPMYKNPTTEKAAAENSTGASQAPNGGNASGSGLSSVDGSGVLSADGKTVQVSPSLFDNPRGQGVQMPRNGEKNIIKIVDTHPRKITEIRVFYDDQTWESFVPKNK
jgi:hypothetical protein